MMGGYKQPTVDLMIDQKGRIWRTGSEALHNWHGLTAEVGDLTSYLLRNMGYVRVRFQPMMNSVTVSLRPEFVGEMTILALAEYLLVQFPTRLAVELIENEPYLQIVGDVEDLLAIVAERSDPKCLLRRRTYFEQPLSLVELSRNQRLLPLKQRYLQWCKARARLVDVEAASAISIPQEFSARIHPHRAELFEIGDGYPLPAASLGRNIGGSVHEQRDQAYGAWVTECLLAAVHEDEPRLEMVEATLCPPDGKPLRVRYERLLLPWSSRAGRIVTSASVTRTIFAAA